MSSIFHLSEEVDMAMARIFAARQLADAVRDKRENIDKVVLSESQLRKRAEDLLSGTRDESDVTI